MPLAAAAVLAGPARAQEPLPLQPSTRLTPTPGGDASNQRPMILRADTLRVRPDIDAVAEGNVEFFLHLRPGAPPADAAALAAMRHEAVHVPNP